MIEGHRSRRPVALRRVSEIRREMRVHEAAAVWAHVQVPAEALEHVLGARPGTPA